MDLIQGDVTLSWLLDYFERIEALILSEERRFDEIVRELDRHRFIRSQIVNLPSAVTEDLNRHWYEAKTGQIITDVQRHIRHPVLRWMAATPELDEEIAGQVLGLDLAALFPPDARASQARREPKIECRPDLALARSSW